MAKRFDDGHRLRVLKVRVRVRVPHLNRNLGFRQRYHYLAFLNGCFR